MEREQMVDKLRDMLDGERFEHSLGVEKTAVELARIHGLDEKKAAIAGLLHDSAKDVQHDPIGFCTQYGIQDCLPRYQDLPLPVLHAPVAGPLIEKEFDVKDPEIKEAIACHTSGKVGMNDFDKLVYLADYTEPMRGNDPKTQEVRRLSKINMDEALLKAMEYSIEHMRSKGRDIHPSTFDAYNDLAKKLGRAEIHE